MVVYLLVFVVWVAVPVGGERVRVVISDIAPLPVGLATWLLCFRTARAPRVGVTVRRAWRRIGVAMLCWWVGDLLWGWFEVVRHREPFPSFADIAYLLFYPCLLWGVLSFFGPDRRRSDRVRVTLDIATVMLAGSMVSWYLVLGPTARSQDAHTLAAVLNVAYPVGDLVVLCAVAMILVGRPDGSSRMVLWVLAAGAALFILADTGYAHLSLAGAYSGGDWPDAGWLAAQVAVLIGAEIEFLSAAAPDAGAAHRPAGVSRLPYLALAVGYGLLLLVGRDRAPYPLNVLLLGAGTLTAVVVARQVNVMRENVRLRDAQRLREAALGEANRLLADTNQKLAEANRAQAAFLGTISHELQTPLTSIVGFSGLLLTEGHRENLYEYARRIARNASTLQKLIDELLEFRDLERRGVPLAVEPLDLSEFVARVTDQLGTTLVEHRLDLELGPGVTVAADPQAMTRILTNLLSNAVRFAPPDTRIGVVVGSHGDSGELSVLDEGPGVREDEQSRIFERFYRGSDPTVALSPGTGIGLAVVRELTQLMGGSVAVANRDGGGACFTVRLPRDSTDD